MNYKTFEEWKACQWLEDGEPRTKAYTVDELLLVEMGWKYGFDAGKEVKELTDEEMLESAEGAGCVFDYSYKGEVTFISKNALKRFVLSILRKASEK